MRKHPKTDLYIEGRKKGMTYQEIAAKYGVSYQAVAQAAGRHSPGHFRVFTTKSCIYIGLRNWLNDNKVSRAELMRRMNVSIGGKTTDRIGRILRGDTYPNKNDIDLLLKVTGMTYEELFAEEETQ